MGTVVETLTELHESLLHDEANAEKAEVEELLHSLSLQELVDAGIAIPRLVITDISSGLYGRTIVVFRPKRAVLEGIHGGGSVSVKQQQEQQNHRLSPGDIVGVFRYDRPITGSSSAVASGVVHKVSANGLSVAFDDEDAENCWLQQHHSVSHDPGGSLGVVYSVCLVSSEVTINRQREALRALREQDPDSPASRVIAVCFDQAKPRFKPLHEAAAQASRDPSRTLEAYTVLEPAATAESEGSCVNWKEVELSPEVLNNNCMGRTWFSDTLTESQRRAVFLSLLSQDVALIHGPPGTGKTTTVVEVLLQLLSSGFRVLACGPSNISVDNMLERCFATAKAKRDTHILKQMKKCVRIGHPARVDEQLSGFCLDRQHLNSDCSGVVRGLKASLDDTLRELNALKRRKPHLSQEEGRGDNVKRELRAEVKRLRKDIKALQKMSVMEALQTAPIVFATCAGAADTSLQSLVKGYEAEGSSSEIRKLPFDVVVIDEAAQALEASCWIPLLLGKRCVLAGDHMQLPPTVRSAEALRRGLGVSLFERLMQLLEGRAAEQLVCQFRMHKHIMAWSNSVFYRSSLVAAACVESRLLSESYPSVCADAAPPVLWIDTAGVSWMREDEQETKGQSTGSALNKSRTNRAEAALVVKYVKELVETFKVKPPDIGVITPYAAQARLIRRLLLEAEEETESTNSFSGSVNVHTVDGFQGREREVIIISLVRSNYHKEIGFLADARRLNVAVTRARSHLVIVGDSETVTDGTSGKSKTRSNVNTETPESPGPQLTQGELASKEQEGRACDTRKALTSLFEVASRFGDIRVPYEYLTSSDVPALDDRPRRGRTEKKEYSAAGERCAEQLQTNGSTSKPVKSAVGLPRNNRKGAPAVLAANVGGNAETSNTRNPADDAFEARVRNILEALCRRRDLARAELAGRSDRIPSDPITHSFPRDLTSYQRLVVHRLAEELNLDHISRGEGAERFIEVRAKSQSASNGASPKPSLATGAGTDSQTEEGSHHTSHSVSTESDARSPAEEPQRNASTPVHGNGQQKPAKDKPSPARRQPKKLSKKTTGGAVVKGDESDDIDALFEQHLLENKKCGHAGCKDSTELLGRVCPYCRSRFCIKHALPEIHGCGDAAALEAKKAFRSQGRNNIRLMTYAQDGTVGKRAATIAGTVFLNPSVGNDSHLRERLATNLRKNIEGKAKERSSQKDRKKKS